MESSDQSDAPCLSFGSHQDALDYADKVVEDCNGFLAAHNLNVIEAYERGDAYLVLQVGVIGGAPCEHDLLFGAIPHDWGVDHPEWFGYSLQDLQAGKGELPRPPGIDSDGSQDCVFVSTTYLVQCPERVIPSLVWLERPKQRDDLLRDMLAIPLSTNFEIRGVASERKVAMATRRKRDRVSSVVKGFPEIVDGVPSDLGSLRQGLRAPHLVHDFLGLIRVGFRNNFVGVALFERDDSVFEILDVNLCSRKFTACTGERISHAQCVSPSVRRWPSGQSPADVQG